MQHLCYTAGPSRIKAPTMSAAANAAATATVQTVSSLGRTFTPAFVMQIYCDGGRVVAGVEAGYTCVSSLGWGLHRPADPLAVLVLLLQAYPHFPPTSAVLGRKLPVGAGSLLARLGRNCRKRAWLPCAAVRCAEAVHIAGWSAWCALCMERVGDMNTGKAGSRVVCTATTAQQGGGTCACTAVQYISLRTGLVRVPA